MKRTLLLILLFCGLPGLMAAQFGIYQHGTVVRMHMGDCVLSPRGFMTTFGAPAGPATPESEGSCPQYTLLSDNIVFVIVGKSSDRLILLSDTVDFRLKKNELAVRIDDAKHETKFSIKEMIGRADWDRMQRHFEEQLKTSEVHAAQRRSPPE